MMEMERKAAAITAEQRNNPTEANTATYGSMASLTPTNSSWKDKMFGKAHLVQSLLHIIQMVVSYGLMLVVMTFNSWLFMSVILGLGVGYFLFGWIRGSVIDKNENCC